MKCIVWNKEYGEMEVVLLDFRTNKAKCVVNGNDIKWLTLSKKDKGANYCKIINFNNIVGK